MSQRETVAGIGSSDFSAASGSIRPGTLLCNGTYRIDGNLGGGGMGEVYRGTNTVTGAPCAIKTIRPEFLQDQLLRGLFVREAEALKSVRDGAVVGYEGVFRDETGRVLIVMDYVDGPSLADRMRGQPLTVDEVTRLARRLARGLTAAHAVGVHHRDLSPDNILLPSGKLDDAVIIDFGIARREGAAGPTLFTGGTHGFTGKVAYASPEQAGAIDAPVDQRSDMFSLGLVLAAAARGRPLPMGDDLASAVAARQRRPDLSSLPKPVQQLIVPLLAPAPGDRPASLEGFASPARPDVKTPLPRSRISWLPWAGGCAVLATLAGVVWVMLHEPASPPPMPPSEPQPSPTEQKAQVPAASQIDHAAIDAMLADVPCANLIWSSGEGGKVRLSGSLPSTGARSDLLARLQSLPGVSSVEDGVTIRAAPDCEAALLIPILIGAPGLDPPLLSLNRADGIYGGNDVFVATVANQTASDLYIYVDYFHEDGNVYHLLPEALARDNLVPSGHTIQIGHEKAAAGSNDRVWHLSAPYGLGRVVAIASEHPLYQGLRKIGEPADTYLVFLGEAIPSLVLKSRMAVSEVPIETRPAR